MAGSLAQVDTFTISSALSEVIIGGGSSSTSGIDFAINTDDVYMLTYINFQGSVNDKYPYMRVTESGTVNTGNNYNYAGRKLKTYSSFQQGYAYNQAQAKIQDEKLGDQDQETANGIIYFYNANNSSEFTFWTTENVNRDGGGNLMSLTGGGAFRVTSAVDGIQFHMESGNIVSGTFTLYKVI